MMRHTSRRDPSRSLPSRFRSLMHPSLVATAAMAAAVGLPGCNGDPFSGDQQAQEAFFFEEDATGVSGFELEGVNGNIDVIAVSGTEDFVVEGFKRVRSSSLADAEEQLERLEVVVTFEGDAIVIRTDQPSDAQGRTFEVEYDLTVPERLEGDILNVNGNILVDSMDDDLQVTTTNGNISLQDHSGSAVMRTTNGNVGATVTMPLGGEIIMRAVNGNMDLDVPQSTSATFSARLANGEITTSNLSLSDAQATPVSLTGVLGNGNGEIDIETVNGNISVRGF